MINLNRVERDLSVIIEEFRGVVPEIERDLEQRFVIPYYDFFTFLDWLVTFKVVRKRAPKKRLRYGWVYYFLVDPFYWFISGIRRPIPHTIYAWAFLSIWGITLWNSIIATIKMIRIKGYVSIQCIFNIYWRFIVNPSNDFKLLVVLSVTTSIFGIIWYLWNYDP
jgi:hypothetical protein